MGKIGGRDDGNKHAHKRLQIINKDCHKMKAFENGKNHLLLVGHRSIVSLASRCEDKSFTAKWKVTVFE